MTFARDGYSGSGSSSLFVCLSCSSCAFSNDVSSVFSGIVSKGAGGGIGSREASHLLSGLVPSESVAIFLHEGKVYEDEVFMNTGLEEKALFQRKGSLSWKMGEVHRWARIAIYKAFSRSDRAPMQ
jgi:hypothetical protein